jgi:hypothetical protein
MYVGSSRMSLRPVVVALIISTEVCSRCYKQAREEKGPKSLVKVKWS